MSRKVETFLLSLKAPLDKSLSITDNSLYTGEKGWREQHKHVQGKDIVRLKQTVRLHTTSGQHKQSTKSTQTSEHHVIELKGGRGGGDFWFCWLWGCRLCHNQIAFQLIYVQKYLKYVISIQICWILTFCKLQTAVFQLHHKIVCYMKFLDGKFGENETEVWGDRHFRCMLYCDKNVSGVALPLSDCSYWKHHSLTLRKGSFVSLNVLPDDHSTQIMMIPWKCSDYIFTEQTLVQ